MYLYKGGGKGQVFLFLCVCVCVYAFLILIGNFSPGLLLVIYQVCKKVQTSSDIPFR